MVGFDFSGEPCDQNGERGSGSSMAEDDASSELLRTMFRPRSLQQERMQYVLPRLYGECSLLLLLSQSPRPPCSPGACSVIPKSSCSRNSTVIIKMESFYLFHSVHLQLNDCISVYHEIVEKDEFL